MKPLHYFLGANASWFLSFGSHTVLFAWLITIELNEAPARVGIGQMTMLLPTLLLILVGGSLADRYGGRRFALIGQSAAALGPISLAVVISTGHLSYSTLLLYALWMGATQAIVTPSRDGLLPRLADGQIQRRVVQVSVIQFGIQVIGFGLAAGADLVGPAPILLTQGAILLLGVVALYKVKVDEQLTPHRVGILQHTYHSILEGFSTIRHSPPLRSVTIQNCVMGTFMMGSYIVTVPLLIRESYEGTSTALAWVNSFNSAGLFFTSMVLLKLGHVLRPGRALLCSLMISALLLLGIGLGLPFSWLLPLMFVWGIGGGLVMTMSRSIMQEQAPPDQRARIMAFFSFSFMGSGLFGALLNGYLVEWLSPEGALYCCAAGTTLTTLTIALMSPLWRLESHPQPT